MLWRALALRLTPNVTAKRYRRSIAITWKRPDGKWIFHAGLWSQWGTMPPPGCSWKPWPHWQLHRNLESTFAELYWPRVGQVHATRLHRTSYLFNRHGEAVSLRDTWIARGKVQP